MENNDVRYLKKIYTEVVQGYSLTVFENEPLVIKHIAIQDQSKLDDIFDKYFQYAKNKSVPTEKDKLAFLEKNKLWTPADDKSLRDSRMFIENLTNTKRNLARRKEIEEINKQIKEEEAKINTKSQERQELLGTTAESFAIRKLNNAYLYNSFYTDETLAKKRFSFDDFETLDPEEFALIEASYINVMHRFNVLNLKKIALTPFFQNIFYLAKSNAFEFYGKAVVFLSIYQSELFSHGMYFKAVLDKENPPPELLSDPDKLIDWVSGTQNIRKQLEVATGSGGGASTLVGASKEDLEAAGISIANSPSLSKASGGKSLNMEDLIKLSE